MTLSIKIWIGFPGIRKMNVYEYQALVSFFNSLKNIP